MDEGRWMLQEAFKIGLLHQKVVDLVCKAWEKSSSKVASHEVTVVWRPGVWKSQPLESFGIPTKIQGTPCWRFHAPEDDPVGSDVVRWRLQTAGHPKTRRWLILGDLPKKSCQGVVILPSWTYVLLTGRQLWISMHIEMHSRYRMCWVWHGQEFFWQCLWQCRNDVHICHSGADVQERH